jgi:hypothetical protein
MLLTDKATIREVILFPHLRAQEPHRSFPASIVVRLPRQIPNQRVRVISKPYEFRDLSEAVTLLSQDKRGLAAWFNDRIPNLRDAVFGSVGGNTFRAFRNMRKKPSQVFRNWALQQFSNPRIVSRFENNDTQKEFDGWHELFCDLLDQYWREEMGEGLHYGAARKLVNLLLKKIVLWTEIRDDHRARLISFLHVPLDQYTLVAIPTA